MIWPFNRKAKPINLGPINEDWAHGDLAECLDDEWISGSGPTTGPDRGDVCKVLEVKAGRAFDGVDRWFLSFGEWGRDWFDAADFRKVPPLNSEADAEFTADLRTRLNKRLPA